MKTLASSQRTIQAVLIVCSLVLSFQIANAQNVGIGTETPHPSAILDLSSDSLGLLIPCMTAAERDAISGPATGLMVFITDDNAFYCYEGSNWEKVGGSVIQSLIQDTDADTRILVEQNPDDDTIRFEIDGAEHFTFTNGRIGMTADNGSIYVGENSGWAASAASGNTMLGTRAGKSISGGDWHTAVGFEALETSTTGFSNTAVGYRALRNSIGSYNTAVGLQSLGNNSGDNNAALGIGSMLNNSSGHRNVAIGRQAGHNSIGSDNVFLGHRAGYSETKDSTLYISNTDADSANALIYGEFDNNWLRVNGRLTPRDGISDTDGDTKIHVEENIDSDVVSIHLAGTEHFQFDSARLEILGTGGSISIGENSGFPDSVIQYPNVYVGTMAGSLNTTGFANTAMGDEAMRFNTTGSNNTSLGFWALRENSGGKYNTALGQSVLRRNTTGQYNTAVGFQALEYVTGTGGNTAIGYAAGHKSVGARNIFLGFHAGYFETGSHKLYIENSTADSTAALIYGEFDNDWLRLNGDVGVGATPTHKLDVDGQIRMRSGSTDGYVPVSDVDGVMTWTAPWDLGMWDKTGSELHFSGNVGIGTTNPGRRLDVEAAVNANVISRFWNTSNDTNADGIIIRIGPNTNPTTTNKFIKFHDGDGTQIGDIGGNGIGGVTYGTSSDRRLKYNIVTYHEGLEMLKQMRPTIYERKSKPGTKEIGFIAQEMQELIPHAVGGSPDQPVSQPMTVDYGRITPVLVSAIQEQQVIIEEQQDVIGTVQEQLDAQQKQIKELKALVLELSKNRDGSLTNSSPKLPDSNSTERQPTQNNR